MGVKIYAFKSCLSGVEELFDNFQFFNVQIFPDLNIYHDVTPQKTLHLLPTCDSFSSTNRYQPHVQSFGKVLKVSPNFVAICDSVDFISII